MAARGWGGSVATAIGVAAGVGAAQLGLGYGLGIISWQPTATPAADSAWVASLAWAAWIAATSVIAGAICADRLGPSASSTLDSRGGPLTSLLWRLALAIAAAIGALITVPLAAVPARAAVRADTSTPHTIAGGYAVLGVVIGLVVAIGALASRAIAANAVASISWLWLLAIVAVIDGVAAGRGLTTAQLGVWEFTTSGPIVRNIDLPRALLTLGAALLIGALAALPAARRGDSLVGVAVSGGVGPLLVASAYFLAAPTFVGIDPSELSAHYVAPYAVIAGLSGSVVVAALGPRLQRVPGWPSGPGGPTGAAGPRDSLPADSHPPARAQDTVAVPAQARGDSRAATGSGRSEPGSQSAPARGTATVTSPRSDEPASAAAPAPTTAQAQVQRAKRGRSR